MRTPEQQRIHGQGLALAISVVLFFVINGGLWAFWTVTHADEKAEFRRLETEIASLASQLEEQDKVVAASENVFDKLEGRFNKYKAELTTLRKKATYSKKEDMYYYHTDADFKKAEKMQKQGKEIQAEWNKHQTSHDALVENYNKIVAKHEELAKTYNALPDVVEWYLIPGLGSRGKGD